MLSGQRSRRWWGISPSRTSRRIRPRSRMTWRFGGRSPFLASLRRALAAKRQAVNFRPLSGMCLIHAMRSTSGERGHSEFPLSLSMSWGEFEHVVRPLSDHAVNGPVSGGTSEEHVPAFVDGRWGATYDEADGTVLESMRGPALPRWPKNRKARLSCVGQSSLLAVCLLQCCMAERL